MAISNAQVQFNENGIPTASQFDDVYFSDGNGLAETQHVFLQNNDLLSRWSQWQSDKFVIAETGFGTGLNFLATCAAFSQFLTQHPDTNLQHLYFISTEKYPLTREDLAGALRHWPILADYAEELIAQYPPAVAGCHRLVFNSAKITLDLWFGDIHHSLPQISAPLGGLVDAWFLDGFAPSKNPQMWSDELFIQMARMAKKGCSFATFTAAGIVKRGLQQVGFTVEKRTGFGRKRHMLAGVFEQSQKTTDLQGYFYRHPATELQTNPLVAVVGGGLAGASSALALVKKGYRVALYCQENGLAQGASGNPQGGFYPHLNNDTNISSELQSLAFLFARRHYQRLLNDGHHFDHQWCGVMLSAFNHKVEDRYRSFSENKLWPEHLIRWIDAKQATELAGVPLPYPGLFVDDGGWISPPQLVNALIAAALNGGDCQIHTNRQLEMLESREQGWELRWKNQPPSKADIVVLATGSGSQDIPQLDELPLRMVRGQVEALPTQAPLDQLKTVICHKGYLTPASDGHHALGSTYVKNDKSCEYRQAEQDINLAMHAKALQQCQWAQQLSAKYTGRAGIRCSTPDHLPLTGAVADFEAQRKQYANLYKALPAYRYPLAQDQKNLYVFTGLGSRGLTTAPLLAEVLACQISGHPLPLSNAVLNALNPNRFLIRDLIRRIQ